MPNGELISVTINDGIKKFSELGRHDNSNDDKSKYKKVCVGDIAYNSMRMWQGASGYSPYEGIVSPAYTVLAANHGVNSRCIAHQFKLSKMIHTFKINSQGITSDNWNLKFPTLSDISIYISRSIDEQGKIASLLESLDHLITLHQSKSFGHILEVIVSCTLSWEQRKFGELFLEKRDKTEIEDEDILLSCAITGIYLNSELFSHFRGTSNIGYLKIKKNDLILSAQNLHLGNANVNLLFEHGIISPAYKVYELNKCDQYFVQSWVKKDSTKDFFLNATTEGASQCRKNIDWCILNNQLIAIPSLYEQISIGKLFHCLNHLITLHQRKLEKLKIIKKSMLENLFPQNGEKTPKIRFSGFNEDWEQRKLGELYELVNEKNDGSYSKDSNITVSTMQFKSNIQISKNEYLNTYNIFKKGYIAFEGHKSKEFRFGRFVENDIGDGIVSHIFIVFRPIMEFDINFWKYAINNELIMQSILSRATKASTMMNDLVVKDFLKEIFFVPSVGEQACIGKTLKYLDHLITLHQLEPFQLIFKAIAYRIIDYAKSKPPRCRKYTGFIAFINTMYKNCVYTQYNHLYSLKSYYIKDIILLIKSAYICKIII